MRLIPEIARSDRTKRGDPMADIKVYSTPT